MSVMDIISPTESEKRVARETIDRLESVPSGAAIQLAMNGQAFAELPPSLIPLLTRALGELAKGGAVTVAPFREELTTQQVAEILNVSRQYVVRLMDDGVIPCRRIGKHRRASVSDVREYVERRERRQRDTLRQLTEEAQDLGIEY